MTYAEILAALLALVIAKRKESKMTFDEFRIDWTKQVKEIGSDVPQEAFDMAEQAWEDATKAERTVSDKLLEALKIAEKFVDRHSESWYTSGQEDLAVIRSAIAEAEAIRAAAPKHGETE